MTESSRTTHPVLTLREVVELAAEDRGTQQTPGMWPLRRHDRGEFLFVLRGFIEHGDRDTLLKQSGLDFQGIIDRTNQFFDNSAHNQPVAQATS